MSDTIRQRVASIKEGARAKTKPAGWVIPKQKSTFGEEDQW